MTPFETAQISDIQNSLHRLFDTEDGKEVISFLKQISKYDVPVDENTSTNMLWRIEGRKDILKTINTMLKYNAKQVTDILNRK